MTKVSRNDITNELRKSMKKAFSNTSIRAIALILLFIVSGIGASVLINPAAATPNTAAPSATAPAAAPAPTQAEANWVYPNGNAFNQDYNPQNQINSSNIQNLDVSWIYPMPTEPTSLLSLGKGLGGTGIQMSILIINGTAIGMTEFDEVFAFNVANGNNLWTFKSPLAPNQTVGEGTGSVLIHAHDGSETFTTATFGSGVAGPTFWFQGGNNRVYAIDALNGKEELNFSDFTGLNMVPGNSPTSVYLGAGASNIAINQQLGILVNSQGSRSNANSGRGFFAGWNLNANPPTMKWISDTTPPQPGSNVPLNPNFDTQLIANMKGAETFFQERVAPTDTPHPPRLRAVSS